MADVRKYHSADFKRKVALEAIRQQKTMNQITAEYGVHASQITAGQDRSSPNVTGSKKIAEFPLNQRKALLDRSGRDLSPRTQYGLPGVNRSGLYYEPVPVSRHSDPLTRNWRNKNNRYTPPNDHPALRAPLQRRGIPRPSGTPPKIPLLRRGGRRSLTGWCC
jgi:hypothetical protein